MRTPNSKWVIVVALALAPAVVGSETVTTAPLQVYGLGTLGRAAYSPDGKHVLTCGVVGAFLWDIQTGKVVRTFSGHTMLVASIAFSPDGSKVLTGGLDRTAELWDASNGTLLRTFSGHKSGISSVAFSPNGTKVLTGSRDGTARLWPAGNRPDR